MKRWPWMIYGALLTSLITRDAIDILSKNSAFFTYYTILIAFKKTYLIYFIFNMISILINLLIPLVVFYYAFDIKSNMKFWKAYFFLRIFFDLTGHYYDLQTIKASFAQNSTYGFVTIWIFTIPLIFSYIAHYLYVFQRPRQSPTSAT